VVVVVVIIVVFCAERVCGCKFTVILGYFRRPHEKFDTFISTCSHTFQILHCTGNWLIEGRGAAVDNLIVPQLVKNLPSVEKPAYMFITIPVYHKHVFCPAETSPHLTPSFFEIHMQLIFHLGVRVKKTSESSSAVWELWNSLRFYSRRTKRNLKQ